MVSAFVADCTPLRIDFFLSPRAVLFSPCIFTSPHFISSHNWAYRFGSDSLVGCKASSNRVHLLPSTPDFDFGVKQVMSASAFGATLSQPVGEGSSGGGGASDADAIAHKSSIEGDELFERKLFDEARKMYQFAISACPSHPSVGDWYNNCGRCEQEMERYESAYVFLSSLDVGYSEMHRVRR